MASSNFTGTQKEWEALVERNKYFIPSIEDIRIGYECQLFIGDINEPSWMDVIITEKDILETIDDINKGWDYIRTAFLNKEQIEADGWKFKGSICSDEQCSGYVNEYQKNAEDVFYNISLNQSYNLSIYQWSVKEGTHTLYNGKCKDVNTFRLITKLLGI